MVKPLDALAAAWVAWVISWGAAAAWTGRTAKRPAIGRELWYRLFTIAGAVVIVATDLSEGCQAVMVQADGWAASPLSASTSASMATGLTRNTSKPASRAAAAS